MIVYLVCCSYPREGYDRPALAYATKKMADAECAVLAAEELLDGQEYEVIGVEVRT